MLSPRTLVRRNAPAIVLLWLASGAALAQPTFYLSSDVPIDPVGGGLLEPWQIVEHRDGSYRVALDVPGPRSIDAVDAVAKLRRPGRLSS